MNTVAIIQARMGSTRLPGKIMMDIEGQPMLKHVVNRLKECSCLDDVIVATSDGPQDDIVEEVCRKDLYNFYRGSHYDVLDRYYKAAVKNHVDTVVRVTGDCPLIDPSIVDRTITAYVRRMGRFDGACNIRKRTFPRGLDTEVFSFEALAKAWEKAEDPACREHVTVYFYRNPCEFRFYGVENGKDLSDLRWTVDEKADLELVRKIYEHFSARKENFGMDDILDFLERNPLIASTNRHVMQKRSVK